MLRSLCTVLPLGAAALFFAWRKFARRSSQPEALLAGKYRMGRVIASGSMAEVWEARDLSGRAVAIKKETLGPLAAQGREYYLREAQFAASLRHPNIVDFYEVLDTPSGVYLVFELLAGKTLRQILIENKRLSPATAVKILKPVCEALDYVHGSGLIHRDVKPTNIMVTEQGFVKLMDFGVARRVLEQPADVPPEKRHDPRSNPFAVTPINWSQVFTGTPIYSAPEMQKGLVSPVSDIYSLGICFYEMLTGETPYKTHSFYLKQDRSYVPPSATVSGLSPEYNRLIYDALHPDPEQRVPSARKFAERLAGLPPG